MRGRTWMMAGVVAGVLAIAGGGAVLAQSGDDAGGSFLDRVAQKLGIESQDLEQAIDDTRNEDIDAAVERGYLTQEQADRLKEKLEAIGEGEFFGHGPFGRGPFHRPFGGPPLEEIPFDFKNDFGEGGFEFGLGFVLPDEFDDFASFLGISPDELKEALAADDATLASVAEAHGKSRDELKAFISEGATAKLDEAVAAGTLTQEQADRFRARLDAMLDKMIDSNHRFDFGGRGEFHFEFHHHSGGDDAPNDPATPDATPAAPQSGSSSGPGRS